MWFRYLHYLLIIFQLAYGWDAVNINYDRAIDSDPSYTIDRAIWMPHNKILTTTATPDKQYYNEADIKLNYAACSIWSVGAIISACSGVAISYWQKKNRKSIINSSGYKFQSFRLSYVCFVLMLTLHSAMSMTATGSANTSAPNESNLSTPTSIALTEATPQPHSSPTQNPTIVTLQPTAFLPTPTPTTYSPIPSPVPNRPTRTTVSTTSVPTDVPTTPTTSPTTPTTSPTTTKPPTPLPPPPTRPPTTPFPTTTRFPTTPFPSTTHFPTTPFPSTTHFPTTPFPTTPFPTTTHLPTFAPTRYPTRPPTTHFTTVRPTPLPTAHPTSSPTYPPIPSPTIAPSNYKAENLSLELKLSQDFLSFQVEVITEKEFLWSPLTTDDCKLIFDDTTNALLGSKALCEWKSDQLVLLVVYLSSESSIQINDCIILKPNVLRYSFNQGKYIENTKTTTCGLIKASDSIKPQIKINTPSSIGQCDNIILDATKSTGFGGRSALFEWYVTKIKNQNNESIVANKSYVVIPNDAFNQYDIYLEVTTWYEETASKNLTVKRIEDAIPVVTLDGLSYFSKDSWNIKNDGNALKYITITSQVSLNVSCLQNNQNKEFGYTWNVVANKEITNLDLWNALIEYIALVTQNKLTLDVNKHLEPGMEYTISLTVTCPNTTCGSEVQSIAYHSLTYGYSGISCQIKGGDHMYIYVDSASNLRNYSMILDASTFTYNLDSITDFEYSWECYIDNEACDYMITNIDDIGSKVQITFFAPLTESSTDYTYQFAVKVATTSSPYASCMDGIEITMIATDVEDQQDILNVVVTALNNQINYYDRVRIVGEIDGNSQSKVYQYKWEELNGHLSKDELETCIKQARDSSNTATDVNLNLVLYCPQYLVPGLTYRFRLAVVDTKENIIASSYVDIMVNTLPVLLQSSLLTLPSCENTIQLSSFKESLDGTYVFTFSVLADGDSNLIYVFELVVDSKTYYVQSNPWNNHNNLLTNTLLPVVGSLSIKATVVDSKTGSLSSYLLQCANTFEIDDNVDICSQMQDIIDNYYNTHNTNAFFQSILNGLLYLYETLDQKMVECSTSILHALYQYVSLDTNDYCTNPLFQGEIALIAQILNLYNEMIVLANKQGLSVTVTNEWKYIVEIIFDPCQVWSSVTNQDLLSVDISSIITQRNIVYYDSVDISTQLSPLFINGVFETLFLQVLSSSFEMMSIVQNQDSLIVLLANSTFLYQLLDISVFIPLELKNYLAPTNSQMQMYSIRAYDSNVEANFDGASVFIPSDIIHKTSQANSLGSTDVLLTLTPNLPSEQSDGLIDKNIQVKLGGLKTHSDLPADVSLVFNDVESDSATCMWTTDGSSPPRTWDTSGCTSNIDSSNRQVTCSCNHITTFSVVIELSEDRFTVAKLYKQMQFQSMHIIFAILFMTIMIYTLVELIPLITSGIFGAQEMTAGLFNTCLIPIYSFLQFSLCAYLIIIPFANDDTSFKAVSGISVITAMISITLSFIMLCAVLYSWVVISYPMSNSVASVRIMKKVYLVSGVWAFALVVTQLVLYFLGNNRFFYIFLMGFNVFIFVLSAVLSYFGLKMHKVVSQTLKQQIDSGSITRSGSDHNKDQQKEDRELLLRIRLSIGVVLMYVFIQMCLNVYMTTLNDPRRIPFFERLFDLLSNCILLAAFVIIYRPQIKRMQILMAEESTTAGKLDTSLPKSGGTRTHKKEKTYSTDLEGTPAIAMTTFVE